MIKIAGITHWGVPVNDLDETERFYTEIMGFTPKGRLSNGTMTCLAVCGQEIVFFQR
jgi:extradiol dioxygenase family protein